ncbi:MAG: 16S rRNA (adenine(1518)-N(6)/adenine(1519)-N(6))-dimethyltransferase RsmA [Alphaproteobacteria bacterium]|nr:16S rRNA (adenine(1518)-N(6)/adenine(1519)-N(6))-dimethyltransferase RsmA [Alphaproteobacteria bacterium]
MDFKLSLREVVESYGLMAKKSLGQNFLLNQDIPDKIIRLSLEKQGIPDFEKCEVFEVGPGPGGLTRAILSFKPKKLTVIEMDERCINIMQDLKDETKSDMDIINTDALKFDFLSQKGLQKQIISNLPYNISVPLLIGWLKKMKHYQGLTLMFQKEVAQRIMADIKSKDYGRISVLAQLSAKIEKLFDINPQCFVPAPKIWSTVLLFQPLKNPLDEKILEKVEMLTEKAFGQRRKMIRQSLKSIPNIETVCQKAGVTMTMRAEEISPLQYYLMAENL